MLGARWTQVGIAAVALGFLGVGVLHRLDRRHGTAGEGGLGRYIPRCQDCHPDVARTYAHVGMARSFRALAEPEPELPAATVRHARSGRYYEVLRRGNRLIQRRYETGAVGAQVNAFELDATHMIGSGNHARTYFHLTEAKELVQLPLTWYTRENRWYLSPGFDRSSPPDFTRRAD